MNQNNKSLYWSGIAYGLLSSCAFGLIPLFTIPLYKAGISLGTACVYRFCISAIVMGFYLYFKGIKFKICYKETLKIALLSLSYILAVITYFYSFKLLPSSLSGTIQYLYPVMVMLIMVIFFHEPFKWQIAISVALAVLGVAFLSIGAGTSQNNELVNAANNLSSTYKNVGLGILLSLLAGLGNSLYMVGIQVCRLRHISGVIITFYVMCFGALFSFIYALCMDSVQWISGFNEFFLALMLALITAVFSNLTLIICIKRVGSTMAAILGVMEPLTAIAVGILYFDDPFTPVLAGGITLIIVSVLMAIYSSKKKKEA